MGHRVSDREELHIEGADLDAVVVADLDERGLIGNALLPDPILGQPDGQRRTDDLERHLLQQIAEGADVVFVAVGGHDALNPVGVLLEVCEVRQDQIDTGGVGVGEHQAAVDQHDSAVDLDRRTVATDLAKPAEEGNPNRRRHQAAARSKVANTAFDLVSMSSGAGPIGSRHLPTGTPSTFMIDLVGTGLGASS